MNIFDNCPAKSDALALNPDDRIVPCCVWRGGADETNINKSCAKCIAQEKRGVSSRRQKLISITKKYNFFYDLSFSNVCNMACRMCHPRFSSKWVAIQEHFGREMPVVYDDEYSTPRTTRSAINQDQVSYLIDHMNNFTRNGQLIKIEIKGGEPLIQSKVKKLLTSLENKNLIALSFISNLNELSPWFFDIIDQFEDVKIHASVEGVEDTYNYIRAGGNFDKFLKNCTYLQENNINWSFSPLILNYNVADLHRLNELYDHFGFEYDENVIHGPALLRPSALPDICRWDLLDIIPDNYTDLQKIIKNEFNSIWDEFKKYTKQLDSYHGSDFLKTPTGQFFNRQGVI